MTVLAVPGQTTAIKLPASELCQSQLATLNIGHLWGRPFSRSRLSALDLLPASAAALAFQGLRVTARNRMCGTPLAASPGRAVVGTSASPWRAGASTWCPAVPMTNVGLEPGGSLSVP